MIIWIDGVRGVGKTTVALKIEERVPDKEVEHLDSDFYFREMLKVLGEYAEENHCPLSEIIGGTSPQTNKVFSAHFRKIIEEKAKKTKNLIISMALIKAQCKDEIFDYLVNRDISILHIILTASKDTIKHRIKFDDDTRDKKTALEILDDSISFLDRNFADTLRIDTDNKSICDVADEIIKIAKFEE